MTGPEEAPAPSADARAAGRRRVAERYEELTGRRFRTIVIEDPQGIRAIAHTARQQVIEVLFGQDRPYTSTELSALTGLTPSAMSYHLRALEKWGVVERAEDEESGDARSRPWRAAGNEIEIRGRGVAGRAASDVWTTNALDALRRRLSYSRELPDEVRSLFRGLSDGVFWLDDDQVRRLGEVVDQFELTLLSEGWRNEPAEGRHHVRTLFSVLPDPPIEPSGD